MTNTAARRPRSSLRRILVAALAIGMMLAPTASGAAARNGGDQAWLSTYDVPGAEDSSRSVAASPDGSRIFVTGGTTGAGLLTIAYDAATGHQLWSAVYDGGGGVGINNAVQVAVSHDGARVVITGAIGAGPPFDVATVAYDAELGTQQWAATYHGPAGDDEPVGLALSPDDTRVFVTGESDAAGPEGYQYTTLAYDEASGVQLWIARQARAGRPAMSDVPSAIGVSADGSRVYVTGTVQLSPTNWDFGTVAYDASTGRELWHARYDGLGRRYLDQDIATDLAVSPVGDALFVIGYTYNRFYREAWRIVGYDGVTGAKRWVAGRWISSGALVAAAAPDGRSVFVSGMVAGQYYDIETVARDAETGRLLWRNVWDGVGWDRPRSIAVAPDGGRVFVTGSSNYGGAEELATVAYDAGDGSLAWSRIYQSGQSTWGASVACSPDGDSVFVTGTTTIRYGDSEVVTIDYRA